MAKPKSVVVIGGGHGSSVVLSGLKNKNVNLSAVLTMADNGGSTGRLRSELGVSAAGDIRNCLAALCESANLKTLFSYRFSSGELEGHSLGNLFLAAGELVSGDIQKSIDFAREALGVEANIYPVSLNDTQLKYTAKDQEVVGMHEIAKLELELHPKLALIPKAALASQARQAIGAADLIIIAPGNFYCSIAQTLLVAGMAEALQESPGRVALITNLVNINRHNAGFSPLDYLDEVNRLLGCKVIDTVIYNQETINPADLKDHESQASINFDPNSAHGTSFIAEKLLGGQPVGPDPNDKIAYIRSSVRHDQAKLAEIICNILA